MILTVYLSIYAVNTSILIVRQNPDEIYGQKLDINRQKTRPVI